MIVSQPIQQRIDTLWSMTQRRLLELHGEGSLSQIDLDIMTIELLEQAADRALTKVESQK